MTDLYDELAALAREEQELIGAGDWDGALALGERWLRLAATLPATPPREALPSLQQAAAAIQSNVAAIEAALVRSGRELERVRLGRRALRSYAGGGRHAVDARS